MDVKFGLVVILVGCWMILAEKLEFLWREYLHKNHEIFNIRNAWVDEFEYGDLSE